MLCDANLMNSLIRKYALFWYDANFVLCFVNNFLLSLFHLLYKIRNVNDVYKCFFVLLIVSKYTFNINNILME